MLEREWVSIRDPDDDHLRYTFDASFLLSRYECIYGRGCRGVRAEGPDETVGCCVHGAYFVDDEDRERVERLVAELTPELFDNHADAAAHGISEADEDGEVSTRVVDGACILLNAGGCALHQLAERLGGDPMDFKPVVCWQLPLHRSISEEVAADGATLEVHTIGPFERGTWGEGGADFHWWCTEDPAAFGGRAPVYRSMERELREMVGDAVYDVLAEHLRRRGRQRGQVRFLPTA